MADKRSSPRLIKGLEALKRWVPSIPLEWALAVVGLVFAHRMLISLSADTTPITNAAFAMALALASVTFGWARALNNEEPVRPGVLFAGEHLIFAAVLLITASALKYAALSLGAATRGGHSVDLIEHIRTNGVFWVTIDFLLGGAVALLFGMAIGAGMTGIGALRRAFVEKHRR